MATLQPPLQPPPLASDEQSEQGSGTPEAGDLNQQQAGDGDLAVQQGHAAPAPPASSSTRSMPAPPAPRNPVPRSVPPTKSKSSPLLLLALPALATVAGAAWWWLRSRSSPAGTTTHAGTQHSKAAAGKAGSKSGSKAGAKSGASPARKSGGTRKDGAGAGNKAAAGPEVAEAPAEPPAPPPEPILPDTLQVVVAPLQLLPPPNPPAPFAPLPLLGQTFVVAEDVDVEGSQTTFGVEEWLGHYPTTSTASTTAPAVARAVAAGASCVAKVAVQRAGLDLVGANFGNVANKSRVAGGGATGVAVEVARRGGAAFGLAVDAVGEARVPAACAGVYAYRPTPGPLGGSAGLGAGAGAGPVPVAAMSLVAADPGLLLRVAQVLGAPGSSNIKGEILQFVVAQDLFDMCAPELQPAILALKKAILKWAGSDQAGAVQLLRFLSSHVSSWRALVPGEALAAGYEADDGVAVRVNDFLEAAVVAVNILRAEELHVRAGPVAAAASAAAAPPVPPAAAPPVPPAAATQQADADAQQAEAVTAGEAVAGATGAVSAGQQAVVAGEDAVAGPAKRTAGQQVEEAVLAEGVAAETVDEKAGGGGLQVEEEGQGPAEEDAAHQVGAFEALVKEVAGSQGEEEEGATAAAEPQEEGEEEATAEPHAESNGHHQAPQAATDASDATDDHAAALAAAAEAAAVAAANAEALEAHAVALATAAKAEAAAVAAAAAAAAEAAAIAATGGVLPRRPSALQLATARGVAAEVAECLKQTVKPDTLMVLPILPFPPPRRSAASLELIMFSKLTQCFNALATLGSCPSLTAPVGALRDGSPVAISLMAVHKYDQRLLAVAQRLCPMIQESFEAVKEEITMMAMQRQREEEEQAAGGPTSYPPQPPAPATSNGTAPKPSAQQQQQQQPAESRSSRGGAAGPDAPAAATTAAGQVPVATSDPKKLDKAEKAKAKGNELYQAGKYAEAMNEYTKAIGFNPGSHVYLSNRAMTCIKLFRFEQAEEDCNKVLKFDLTDKDKVKALLRRATARDALQKYDVAEQDLRAVLRLEPNNKQAREDLRGLRQHQAQMAEAQAAMVSQMRAHQAAAGSAGGPLGAGGPMPPGAAGLPLGMDPGMFPPGFFGPDGVGGQGFEGYA